MPTLVLIDIDVIKVTETFSSHSLCIHIMAANPPNRPFFPQIIQCMPALCVPEDSVYYLPQVMFYFIREAGRTMPPKSKFLSSKKVVKIIFGWFILEDIERFNEGGISLLLQYLNLDPQIPDAYKDFCAAV